MKNTKWYLLIVVLLLGTMALVACGGGTETTEQPVATEAAEEVMAEPTEEVMAEPTEEMMAEPTEEVMAEPTEEMAEEMAGEMTLASDTSKSIATLLSEDPNFSTLVAAITAAEIAEPGPDAPVTIFAPTNAAFEALPEGMVDELLADPAGDLTRILQYHLVNGAVKAADVTADEDGFVDTLAGEPLDLAALGLVATDVEGSNGVIHVIDAVQVPPTIANAARAEELLSLIHISEPTRPY